MTPAPKRRGRPRKVKSYADWCAKVDSDVAAMAAKMERKPPTFADPHPAQRKIVQWFIEHMRSLPGISPSEDECKKPEYALVKLLISGLFERK